MKIIDPGHSYALDQLDGIGTVELRFVKRQGPNYPGNTGAYRGTTLQEVCRACIDRVKYVDKQKPHKNNTTILYLFRTIIWLLEERAFEQHGQVFEVDVKNIEELATNVHGHLWKEDSEVVAEVMAEFRKFEREEAYRSIPERYALDHRTLSVAPVSSETWEWDRQRHIAMSQFAKKIIEELGAAEARADDWIKRCTIAEAALAEAREEIVIRNYAIEQQAKQLSEARKERNEFRERLKYMREANASLVEQRTVSTLQVARQAVIISTLAAYGKHLSSCKSNFQPHPPCTCGLDVALASIPKEQP